jgi:hypothetical protein
MMHLAEYEFPRRLLLGTVWKIAGRLLDPGVDDTRDALVGLLGPILAAHEIPE